MGKKNKNSVSDFYKKSKDTKDPELIIRECFLRLAKEVLDNYGIDKYSLEQIRGGVLMLEKFNEINEE